MPPVVIENPILNSPFAAPRRHFKFGPDGITNEIVERFRVKDLLNLIAEGGGAARTAKAAPTRNLWVPAVRNHGGYSRWAFVDVSGQWDVGHTMRSVVRQSMELFT